MGINSSGNMFSLCSANYGIEKLIVMEKQGGKNMESKKSESDNQKIHIFLAPGAHVVGDVTLGDNVGSGITQWCVAIREVFLLTTIPMCRITVHCIQMRDIPSISGKVSQSDIMR